MSNDTKKNDEKTFDESVDYLPGTAVDVADDEKVDEKMVDNRTKTENDNPRDNDLF